MATVRALPICLLLLIITGISRADADTIPFHDFTATYRGEANGMAVKNLGTRTLKSLGEDRYHVEYKADAMIYSLRESSLFQWEEGRPKPLTYDSSRGTFLKKRENHIVFDWQSGMGRYVHKKHHGEFPLTDGVQDPLSSTLLLADAVQSGKASIKLIEAKDDGQEERVFVLLGTPVIDTPAGQIKTYHLERKHDDSKRHTEIWLHHEHPYIPVKVEQMDDGDRFLLELTGFTLN